MLIRMTGRVMRLLIAVLSIAATSLFASELPPPVVPLAPIAAATSDGKVVPPRWLQRVPSESFPFMVVTDQKTGKTCQVMPADGCSENAERLPGSRSLPDVEGLHIALLQFIGSRVNEAIRRPTRWYVTVTSSAGVKGDPSPLVTGFVHIWNVSIEAGSHFPGDEIFSTGAPRSVMHYTIGAPERRPDGSYNVSYSYYCGSVCAASFTAVMSHDGHGWHILSTTMDMIA